MENDGDDDPQPDPVDGVPRWCICKNCIQMPTPEDNKCCQRRECITSYELFSKLCIDRHVLELVIRARCHIRVEPLDFSMASFRRPVTGSLFYRSMVTLVRGTGVLLHHVLLPRYVTSILPLTMYTWVSGQSNGCSIYIKARVLSIERS